MNGDSQEVSDDTPMYSPQGLPSKRLVAIYINFRKILYLFNALGLTFERFLEQILENHVKCTKIWFAYLFMLIDAALQAACLKPVSPGPACLFFFLVAEEFLLIYQVYMEFLKSLC